MEEEEEEEEGRISQNFRNSSGTKNGALPTFFYSHFHLLFLPSSCSFSVPFTTFSLFAPNNDAVPSILHSCFRVTSFDRPLLCTVDLFGPSTNTSNQSPLISGFVTRPRPGCFIVLIELLSLQTLPHFCPIATRREYLLSHSKRRDPLAAASYDRFVLRHAVTTVPRGEG